MADPAQLALVQKAITSGLSNCIEWVSDDVQVRVRNDAALGGLTPRGIKQLLVDWVQNQNGAINQRVENRPNWVHRRDYWYFVLIPVAGLPRELFVELELTDDDDDCPVVTIVNAHLTSP